MAVIIQANPYLSLIRKIGYSVGLEKLVNRVSLLVDLYVSLKAIPLVKFSDLVRTEYERKDGSVDHFINFYNSLNLLYLTGRELHPLYYLDCLSILRRYFNKDEDAFRRSLQFILLLTILEADGDIFLNALASDFQASQFKSLLIGMLEGKRSAIRNVIGSPHLMRKIYSIIDIKAQGKQVPKTEALEKKVLTNKFSGRTRSLDAELRRSETLSGEVSSPTNITDDYLRKVPPTRKGWAEDLGLFLDGQKTNVGNEILDLLNKDLSFRHSSGAYLFWPYQDDLSRLRINPADIGSAGLTRWKIKCVIFKAMSQCEVGAFNQRDNYDDAIKKIYQIYRLYKEASESMRSIRHQIPLYVLQPCIVCISLIEKSELIPLPEIIEAESIKPYRRIQKTTIRETEGGIVISKGELKP